jgi:homeobox-leucine zipper protein
MIYGVCSNIIQFARCCSLFFCYQDIMENEGQLNNNSYEQDHDGFTMDEIPDLPWNSHMEYDVDALLGAEDHVNTNQTTDDVDHRSPMGETPSKRAKRFTMDQIQELEA